MRTELIDIDLLEACLVHSKHPINVNIHSCCCCYYYYKILTPPVTKSGHHKVHCCSILTQFPLSFIVAKFFFSLAIQWKYYDASSFHFWTILFWLFEQGCHLSNREEWLWVVPEHALISFYWKEGWPLLEQGPSLPWWLISTLDMLQGCRENTLVMYRILTSRLLS